MRPLVASVALLTLHFGSAARAADLAMITRSADTWHVRQVFDDPGGDRDWGISADIDLAASDEAGEPVIAIVDVGALTGD